METAQAAIIATEMFRLYAHCVLGGVYKPVDYADFEMLTLKAKLLKDKTEAMNNVLRAMHANDAGQEEYWQAEIERIDAERREHGFIM